MRRSLRHLGHPLLTIALLLALALDAAAWAHLAGPRHHPFLIPRIVYPPRAPGPRLTWTLAYLVDESGTLRVLSAGTPPPSKTYAPHNAPGHTLLAQLSCNPIPSHSGLIAPVLTRTDHTLTVVPISVATLTPAQLAAARTGYADHLAAWLTHRSDDPALATLLAARDGVRTRVNTVPLIHDILITPILLLTAASFALTLVRGARWLFPQNLPAHLCPTCRYDRTGLRTTAPCPECGHSPTPQGSDSSTGSEGRAASATPGPHPQN